MISKPLFKQSCKANIGIWSFVTFITCAMLAIIIIVIGNLNVGGIRDSMVDMFVKDSIEATIKRQSMTYYNITSHALTLYDEGSQELNTLLNTTTTQSQHQLLLSRFNALKAEGKSDEEAKATMLEQASSFGLSEDMLKTLDTVISYFIFTGGEDDCSKEKINEFVLRSIEDNIYKELVETEGEESADQARMFISQAVTDYLASDSENADDFATFYIPEVLKNVFSEQSFEYNDKTINVTDYFTVDDLGDQSLSSIISFKAELSVKRDQLREEIKLEYNTEHPNEPISDEELNTLVEEQIATYTQTLIKNKSGSLLEDIPTEIAEALTELGEMDISALIIGSMFFRMAGILLPVVYIIMASNNLVASQVDSGSMAYVLSTPTKRITVTLTQMTFLILSLFAMFACTTIVGVVTLAIVNSSAITITISDMLLFNLGAFITMFAISGICYLASSWFNRSKLSMAVGGGLSMFFIVATILGLFGSSVMPAAMRISAMNVFNYVSIISLFDCVSIMAGNLTFLWKLAILLVIGIVTYIVAIIKFKKKDLPL